MRRFVTRFLWLGLAAGVAASCETGADRVLTISETGTVSGHVFVDRDGNNRLDPDIDAPAPGIRMLLLRGVRDTVARATSDDGGNYVMQRVPVGQYQLTVDAASIPDTLRVGRGDTTGITVTARATAEFQVSMSFPRATVAEARKFAVGTRVLLEGVALNGWHTFGDSTVHILDETGSIRATRSLEAAFSSGDTVRIIGSIAIRDGQPTVNDATIILLRPGAEPPPPVSVSAAVAATANGGQLDAAQVRVSGATIIDRTLTAAGDLLLTTDDGSGILEIVIDQHAGISFEPYTLGGVLDVVGLLVPTSTGTWRLKPRSVLDLAISFPTLTVAQARAEPIGKRVFIRGKALTSWNIFGDNTLHLADVTGAIRAMQVRAPDQPVAPGDSIGVLGRVSVFEGQPVLIDATVERLSSSEVPVPVALTTARAATADQGQHDAALARIINAMILAASPTLDGDLRVTVDDDSGPLEVLLHAHAGINFGPFVPGAVLNSATGVLVPTQGGARWQLKPRSNADLNVDWPTVTVGQARREVPVGGTVRIRGIALNSRGDFRDGSVHLWDPTGAIRATNVFAGAPVAAGDSISLLGTLAVVNGQRVLRDATPTRIRIGVGLPTPIQVTAARAATADQGQLDAAQVRVVGVTIVEMVPDVQTGDLILTVQDGSGSLQVVIDPNTGISGSRFSVGATIDVNGVLVPVPVGGTWQLKPRTNGDITVR